ncbi:hypothetical protein A6K25_15175 [Alteromonas stellipolaris]|uniref:hypothetical protein n=1 Tax=Alteromonas stellipolaris TaxID=233316 RepID=UPI0007B456C9|nr:hypothetical protein [Alteromonas stellipolaris]ANB22493.1 hypothetical protein A6K25_15175 [Alteromonas stellipolaris]
MDRLVQICNSSSNEEIDKECLLSEALSSESIVLLGDPGMGKSYSFEYFSSKEKGSLYKASNFDIYVDENDKGNVVYIDGLDEERVSSDGKTLVKDIVKKLNNIKPSKIRISCRAIDWLGETDLQLFLPLFKGLGSYKVIALKQLSVKDIHTISSKKVGLDEIQFLSAARQKKIEYLLDNPLTLLMLIDLVGAGIWPTNKFALFYETVKILLVERNESHISAKDTHYSFEQLLSISGKLFAHLLIAGVQTISSVPVSSDSDINKKELGFNALEIDKVLSTKVFSNISSGVFAPKHRTIAEFLGGLWLSEQLNKRMTLNRLLHVMGFEGVPVPELRGMFAWLASSNQFANDLLRFDPMGALLYGDVERLSESNKTVLLRAIEEIAEADPLFYPSQSHEDLLGHLSSIANFSLLENILVDETSSVGIKIFVLKVIEKGPLQPSLESSLTNCLINGEDDSVRYHTIDSIFSCLPNATAVLMLCFRDTLKFSDDTKDLQVRIINLIYNEGLSPNEVAKTLFLFFEEEHSIYGSLWNFGKSIPTTDIGLILDELFTLIHPFLKKEHLEVSSEFIGLINQFISRCIELEPLDIGRLYDWLSIYKECVSYGCFYYSKNDSIANLLSANQQLLWELFLVHTCRHRESTRYGWHEFTAISRQAFDNGYIFDRLYETNLDLMNSPNFDPVLYELNLYIVDYDNINQFRKAEILIDKCSLSIEMAKIVETVCFNRLTSWEFKKAVRDKSVEAKKEYARNKNIADFEANREKISKATDQRWLEFSANIFFARFGSIAKDLTHRERLYKYFEVEQADVLLNSLILFVQKVTSINIKEVLDAFDKNKIPNLSYAVLAGISLYWEKFGHLDGITEDLLAAALPLERLIHTSSNINGKQTNDEREWVVHLVSHKRNLVKNAYYLMALAKSDSTRSSGINSLCRLSQIDDSYQLCLKRLLVGPTKFNYYSLVTIFDAIELTVEVEGELIKYVKALLLNNSQPRGEVRQFWLSVYFMLDPEEVWARLKRSYNSKGDIIWILARLFQNPKLNSNLNSFPFIRKKLVILLSKRFKNCDAPRNGWSGDNNPWDAAQFIRTQIMQIATVGSYAATTALQDLLKEKSLDSYSHLIKHALFKQKEVYRQESYKKPNWEQTVNSLSCGKPSNLPELQSVVLDVLNDIQRQLSFSNTDTYKSFWNEDGYGRTISCKNEESCRDRLLEYLELKLSNFALHAEPESHMARDKRADILVYGDDNMKLPIEIKRENHRELWTAAEEQLQRLYSSGINSHGYGIYLVFWFSGKHTVSPSDKKKARSPKDLEAMIRKTVDSEKIRVFVIDISGDY